MAPPRKRLLLAGSGLAIAALALAGLRFLASSTRSAVPAPQDDSATTTRRETALLERYRSAFTAFHRVRLKVEEEYQEAPRVSLPIERIVGRLLRGVGLTVVTAQADTADLEILVWVRGTYVTRNLDGIPVYSGAVIEGSVSVQNDSLTQVYRAFEGRNDPSVIQPASPANEAILRRRMASPEGAPYIHALSAGGDSSFLAVLAVLLRDISGRADALVTTLSSWPPDALQFSLIYAVAAVGGPVAIDHLLRIVTGGGPMAGAAARALGRVRDPQAFQPLLALLQQRRWASEATEALGDLGDARAVEPLLTVLKRHDGMASADAARALGMLGDLRAVAPLIDAMEYLDPERAQDPNLKDSDLRFPMRSDASFALFQLTRQNFGDDIAKWRAWWREEQSRRGRSP